MAIKTSSQGTLPAIDLNYIQFSNFQMSVQEKAPHRISVAGKMRAYGVSGGKKYYSVDVDQLNISDLDGYITNNVPPERQIEAVAAMVKVQEGLGTLASIVKGVTFIGVE